MIVFEAPEEPPVSTGDGVDRPLGRQPRPYGFWSTVAYSIFIYGATLYVTMPLVFLLQYLYITSDESRAWAIALGGSTSRFDALAALYALIFCALASVLTAFVVWSKHFSFREYFHTERVPFHKIAAFAVPVFAVQFICWCGVSLGVCLNNKVAQSIIDRYDFSEHAWLIVLVVVLCGPFFEEFFWRGFVFTGIARSRVGPVSAIVITAALFALTHFQGKAAMGVVFSFGLYLGWARNKTRSVFLPFVLHALWNASGCLLSLFLQ